MAGDERPVGQSTCPVCGDAIGEGYQNMDTRPVRASDGIVYCSAKCLWRDFYILRRGLGKTPHIPAR